MSSLTAFRSLRPTCRQCMAQSRRHFWFSSKRQEVRSDLPPLPPFAGHSQITNRAIISIQGHDSTAFLHGLLTRAVVSPAKSTDAFYAAFLNAQGRVLHDVFVYPAPPADEGKGASDPGYFIEVDKAEVSNLMKHLKKHKLRSKIQVRALDEGELNVWAFWDEDNEAASPIQEDEGTGVSLSCVDNRAPGFGIRLLSPGYVTGVGNILPGENVPLSTYTLRRILHGVPEGQGEIIRESALPMECNLDMMGAIDYHKGCYVGQELTIRTHHRGVVRKRILPVQLYGVDEPLPEQDTPSYSNSTKLNPPPSGSDICKVSARKGRSAGKFLYGMGNVGLALCRLEMMTDIALTGESSQYDPKQEFQVSWDAAESEGEGAGQVKLKALVPPWTRAFVLEGASSHRGESSQASEPS